MRAKVLKLVLFVTVFIVALFWTLRFCGAQEGEVVEVTIGVEAPAPLVEGVTVTLSAEVSGGTPVSYEWTQAPEEPQVMLTSLDGGEKVEFVAPKVEPSTGGDAEGVDLHFTLTVSVLSGGAEPETAGESVTVTVVNQAPVAEAGAGQSVMEGETVTLDGSGSSDPEGHELTWLWTCTSDSGLALSGADGPNPTFTAPAVDPDGKTLTLRLTVTDVAGASDADTCAVTVGSVNAPPVADAGGDKTAEEGEEVLLDGSGSVDPEGDTLTWSWTQIDGVSVDLSDSAAAKPVFTAPNVGNEGATLEFQLEVADPEGLTDRDSCLINVLGSNDMPHVDAGGLQEVIEGDTVILDGSGSSDPEGGSLSYRWVQTDGPDVDLQKADEVRASFVAPEVDPIGAFLAFDLYVEDPGGLKDRDHCFVDVLDSGGEDEAAGESEGGDGGGGGCASAWPMPIIPALMLLFCPLLLSGAGGRK